MTHDQTFHPNPTPEAWAVITLRAVPESEDGPFLPDGARLLDERTVLRRKLRRTLPVEQYRFYASVRPVLGWTETDEGSLVPVVADDEFGITGANVRAYDPASGELPTASVLRGPGQERSIDLDSDTGRRLIDESVRRHFLLCDEGEKSARPEIAHMSPNRARSTA